MRKVYLWGGVFLVVDILVAVFWYLVVQNAVAPTSDELDPGQVEIVATTSDTNLSAPPQATTSLSQNNNILPALMALDMKTWKWQEAQLADGQVLTPIKPGVFTLEFSASGAVSIGTDCNSMSSTYEAYSGTLTFGSITSTKMYCEGSQEGEFAQLLGEVKTYQFTGRSELILKTKDGATVVFE